MKWRLAWPLLLPLLAGCDASVIVSSSGFGAFEADVVVSRTDEVAVVWYDDRHGNEEIYLRRFDAGLRPLSPGVRLSHESGASYEPDVELLGSALAVAWYDRHRDGGLALRVGLFDAAGQQLWLKRPTPPTVAARIPVLAAHTDKLFVAWVEDAPEPTATARSRILAAWFDQQGRMLQPPFVVAPASRTTWNLNAATLRDGRVALVFDAAFETDASELYLALIDAGSVALQRLSQDDGHDSKYPDVAVRGDVAALSWHDARAGNNEVHLALFGVENPPDDIGLTARRLTHTLGDSIGAYLAWNGERLGLAWNDDTSGQHDLWFQSFDAAGQPDHEARRLTRTPAASLIPSIAPLQQGFVLAWGEVELANGSHAEGSASSRGEIMLRRVP